MFAACRTSPRETSLRYVSSHPPAALHKDVITVETDIGIAESSGASSAT